MASLLPSFVKEAVMGQPLVDEMPSCETQLKRFAAARSDSERAKILDELAKLAAADAPSKAELGHQASIVLLPLLRTSTVDAELVRSALKLLIELVTDTSAEPTPAFNHTPAVVNAELLVEDETQVAALLALLGRADFYTRYHTVQLLTALVAARPGAVQRCVLQSPTGVAAIIDLLSDRKEVLRNEGLLLLNELVRASVELQKIVAFGAAFERLAGIMEAEGYAAGGIVVQDCLVLLRTLLEGNQSNQVFFRETSQIGGLAPLLRLSDDARLMTEQTALNIVVTLEILSDLVAAATPHARANQQACYLAELLVPAWALTSPRVRADFVRHQALRTVADLMRGHADAQRLLAGCLAPASAAGARAERDVAGLGALQYLAHVVVHGTAHNERAGAAYALAAYLEGNPDGQLALVSSLTPPPDELYAAPGAAPAPGAAEGRVLVAALFAPSSGTPGGDGLASVLSAAVIASALCNCDDAKDLALRLPVQLEAASAQPITLFALACTGLVRSVQRDAPHALRWQLSIMGLLCVWLHRCPAAVAAFVHEPAHLPLCIELLTQSQGNVLRAGLAAALLAACLAYAPDTAASSDTLGRSGLRQLLLQRVGADVFADRLARLQRAPAFARAEASRAGVFISASEAPQADELVAIDHATALAVKAIAADGARALAGEAARAPHDAAGRAALEASQRRVRELEAALARSEAEGNALRAAAEAAERDARGGLGGGASALMAQLERENLALTDELARVRATAASTTRAGVAPVDAAAHAALQAALERACRERDDAIRARQGAPLAESAVAAELEALRTAHAALRDEQDELFVCLAEMEGKLNEFRRLCDAAGLDYTAIMPREDDDDDAAGGGTGDGTAGDGGGEA